MINRTKKIISHQLFSGSIVVIFGTNIVNAFNYLYHLIMGRILGPQNYGELAATLSLMTLLGMLPLSLSLIVTKYISAAENIDEIKKITFWFRKKIFIIAVTLTVITVLSAPFISKFMNLNHSEILLLIAFTFLFQIPLAFNRALLQGVLKFNVYTFSLVVETVIKLVLGVVLVYIGFAVYGAVLAIILGVFLSWLLTLTSINKYAGKNEIGFSKEKVNQLLKYSMPVILQSLAITSFFSADIVLVKHFFSSYDSGIYAAMSTLGKIIYFAAGPIALVMFPIVSGKHARGEKYLRVFLSSFALSAAISVVILTFYWVFPTTAISLLFGSLYLTSSFLLPWFGVFITLMTLSYLVINYFLSIDKTNVVLLPVIAALAQIGGIYSFHNSLQEVVMVSVWVSAALFISLCLFFINSVSAKIKT